MNQPKNVKPGVTCNKYYLHITLYQLKSMSSTDPSFFYLYITFFFFKLLMQFYEIAKHSDGMHVYFNKIQEARWQVVF